MELLAVNVPCLPRSGWACDFPGPAHVLNQAIFLSLLDLGSSGTPNLPQLVPLPPGQPVNYGALHSLCLSWLHSPVRSCCREWNKLANVRGSNLNRVDSISEDLKALQVSQVPGSSAGGLNQTSAQTSWYHLQTTESTGWGANRAHGPTSGEKRPRRCNKGRGVGKETGPAILVACPTFILMIA